MPSMTPHWTAAVTDGYAEVRVLEGSKKQLKDIEGSEAEPSKCEML